MYFDEENRRRVNARAVKVEDETGEIMYFPTVSSASLALEVPATNISKCCRGLYKSSFGYKFSYCEDKLALGFDYTRTKRFRKEQYSRKKTRDSSSKRGIVVVDLPTKSYRIYTSIETLCNDLELDSRNVYKCLTHPERYKTYMDYEFCFEKDFENHGKYKTF